MPKDPLEVVEEIAKLNRQRLLLEKKINIVNEVLQKHDETSYNELKLLKPLMEKHINFGQE